MGDSKFLNTLLTVVPILSAVLYLMGFTYHEGFISAYALESSLFPLASDTTLLYGFYALLSAVLNKTTISYAVIAMFALVFVVILAYILASSSRVHALHVKLFKRKGITNKNNPDPEIKQKFGDILEKGEILYYYFVGTLLIFFVVILLARFALNSGKESALTGINNFENRRGKWVMLYSFHSSSPIRAQQITCGNTHCGFWLGNKSLVLAHDKIEKVVAYNDNSKK